MLRTLFLWLLLAPFVAAVEIRIDYRFDTNGYFDPPERRESLEAAARFYSDLLQDRLLSIDPADFSSASWTVLAQNPQTGAIENIPNPTVDEDVIIVFAGARELGGNTRGVGGVAGFNASGFSDWFSRIRGRGNPGADVSQADADQATDFAPSFGFVSFDISTNFNFSSSPDPTRTDFLSVALHELGHVLGIGVAASWDNHISGQSFTGPASLFAAGGPPAVEADGGHFAQSLSSRPAFGSFATAHGLLGSVLMRPSLNTLPGQLIVATDLDLAALVDIGWEVVPPVTVIPAELGPGGTELQFPSSSFRHYRIERNTELDFPAATEATLSGNGFVQSWEDPAPPPNRAFYRIVSEARTVQAAANQSAEVTESGSRMLPRSITKAPRWVENCSCGPH
jgi:hypothetical protein